jgi:hypothetical protein
LEIAGKHIKNLVPYHDNERSHSFLTVQNFLMQNYFSVIAQCDFNLSPAPKMGLRIRRFVSAEVIQQILEPYQKETSGGPSSHGRTGYVQKVSTSRVTGIVLSYILFTKYDA